MTRELFFIIVTLLATIIAGISALILYKKILGKCAPPTESGFPMWRHPLYNTMQSFAGLTMLFAFFFAISVACYGATLPSILQGAK